MPKKSKSTPNVSHMIGKIMRESKPHRLNKPVGFLWHSAQSTTSRCILPQCPLILVPINAKWCLTNAFVHGISVMHRLVSNHWYTIIRIEIPINGQRVKLLQTSLNVFFRSETIGISTFLQWQRRPCNETECASYLTSRGYVPHACLFLENGQAGQITFCKILTCKQQSSW